MSFDFEFFDDSDGSAYTHTLELPLTRVNARHIFNYYPVLAVVSF